MNEHDQYIESLNEIEFKYLTIGESFYLDGILYTKTNHGRAFQYVKINDRPKEKRFIVVKKNKLVRTEVKKWDTDE